MEVGDPAASRNGRHVMDVAQVNHDDEDDNDIGFGRQDEDLDLEPFAERQNDDSQHDGDGEIEEDDEEGGEDEGNVEGHEAVRLDLQNRILGPDDPERMMLSAEELEWALDIKDAFGMVPELDRISDFMCAQWAVKLKGDVEEAVRRALILQAYREEYGVNESSLEDGIRGLIALLQLCPRQFMSWSYSKSDGRYVLVHDVAALDASTLRNPDRQETFFRGSYWLHHAMCMDMESIRKGWITIAECVG